MEGVLQLAVWIFGQGACQEQEAAREVESRRAAGRFGVVNQGVGLGRWGFSPNPDPKPLVWHVHGTGAFAALCLLVMCLFGPCTCEA